MNVAGPLLRFPSLMLAVYFVSGTHFVVGLDAGASKTLLRAHSSGSADVLERRGPGANPSRVGLDRTVEVLVDLTKDAVRDGTAPARLSVCAGVAGAGRPDDQAYLTEALQSALTDCAPHVHVEVVHDALIALDAAYDGESGLVIIAGTGSVVLARPQTGDLLRAGGWGHVLGDDGSGYAIGRAGLRAVAEAFDGGRDTMLRDRLREEYGIDDRESLLQTVYQDDLQIQAVAPIVINTAADGDAVASRILAMQATRLTKQVEWVLGRAAPIASHITLLGGMIQNEYYTHLLRRVLRDHFPDGSVEVLQDDPVRGALRRADRLHLTASD